MKKIAEKLLSEKKITAEEFDSVKDMTKEAFLGLLTESGGKLGLGAGGQAVKEVAQILGLTGLAGMLGAELAGKAKEVIQSQTAYDTMMKKIPQLSEYPEDEVKDFYSVVKTFSPKAASNPLVAGALVNKMLQFGGVDHKLVQDIANIEGEKRDLMGNIVRKAGETFIQFPKD
jgi:hypothetical protein